MSANRGRLGLRRQGKSDPSTMTLDRASMRNLQFLLLQRQLSVWVASVFGVAVPAGDQELVDELRTGETLCELLASLYRILWCRSSVPVTDALFLPHYVSLSLKGCVWPLSSPLLQPY